MRFALLEQARNRLALVIVVVFVPVWTTLAFEVVTRLPVRFYVRPAGRAVTMDGNVLTQITGALQALALIVGFMMFVATARSAPFDQRLALAGYPRLCLALAKISALVLVAAAVAAYATAWMHLFWQPRQLPLFAAGLFTGALIYGGIGIVLAAVLRSELAGMFLVIMISFIDLLLQNPISNPDANSAVLRYLPAYGAMQSAVAGGALASVTWSSLLLGAGWAAAAATSGMTAFALGTRSHRPQHSTTAPAMSADVHEQDAQPVAAGDPGTPAGR
ncbi:ABC transporter permease [Streptomyces canus]|uniref:ABC transporter permease n=1 Tax=Streptomyces canus TaxID=58343 RepID=UPI002E37B4AC|nr:ABC transporter permease [Streptomyces canus]